MSTDKQEHARLRALRSYQLLDTPAESDYDRLIEMVAQLCEVDIALISFLDDTRQWIKAGTGVGVREIPKSLSFCQYTIQGTELIEIQDARSNPEYAKHPLVAGPQQFCYYAGLPLIDPDGYPLGTLCIIDRKPNNISEKQRNLMKVVAAELVQKFVARKERFQLEISEKLYELTEDLACILDQNGIILRVNPSFEKIFGSTKEDLVGRYALDFFHPNDLPDVQRKLHQLLTGESCIAEIRTIKKDGTYLDIQWAVTPQSNGAFFYATGRDISALKIQEKQLFANELRYRSIIENADNAFFLTKPDGTILEANAVACKLFGYTVEELKQNGRQSIIDSNDPNLEIFLRKREKEGRAKAELTGIKKNGERFICDVISAIFHDENGEQRTTILMSDASERKAREETIRQSEETFKSAFESSAIGMALVSPDGKWIRVNTILAHYVGYEPEELIGQPFSDISYPDDVEKDKSRIKELLNSNKKRLQFEKRYLHKKGYDVWVEINVSLIKDKDENPLYFVSQIQDVTAKKESELRINKLVSELTAILNASNEVSIIGSDRSGIITHFNKGAEHLLGYTAEEAIGKLQAGIVHKPEEVVPMIEYYQSCLDVPAEGFDIFIEYAKKYEFENREWTYVRKDGSEFPVQLYFTMIKDESGEITGMVGVAVDKSKIKDTEKRLQESDQRWRFALEGTGDGIWDWNLQKNIVYYSDQWKTLLGHEPHEIGNTRHEWSKRIHPEDFPKCNADLTAHLEGKTPLFSNQHRVLCKDGSYKWILVRGKVIEWKEDGKALRVIGTHTDLTDRVEAELKIKLSENKFRSLFELSPVGIALNDFKTGQFLEGNKALLAPTQYNWEEFSNLSFWDLTPSEFHDLEKEQLRLLNEVGQYGPYEKEYIRKDGTRYPVLLNGVKVTDDLGREVIWSVVQDISDRKKTETDLLQAKEQAIQANKTKSEFLANMSHEIRTPLNGVIGFTDLLMKTELNDTQRQYMSSVFQSANSLLDIINDILDFSKIEAGRMELDLRPSSLVEMGQRVTDIVKFEANRKGLELNLKTCPYLPELVNIDSIRLQQILVNLLGNAIKFTHEGKIELRIETLEKTKTGAIFRFSVIDTGIGISLENQQKIFEAFTQEDTSTTRKFGGTGLGLSISNKLLALMESQLQLKTELGKGSTFYFDVEFEEARALPVKHSVQTEINTSSGIPAEMLQLSGTKILVAEDNRVNMLLIKAILHKINPKIELIEACNGQEAVNAVLKHSPNMVFMDVQMPILNGYEATRKIREHSRLPIIALTAGTVKGEMEKCLSMGMDDYVSKPIIPGTIEKCLLKWAAA